jgi:hypothetical protein
VAIAMTARSARARDRGGRYAPLTPAFPQREYTLLSIDGVDSAALLWRHGFGELTWRGRTTECVGFDGLDLGVPCWPLRSKLSFRSGTYTAPAAFARVNRCLEPPREFIADQ